MTQIEILKKFYIFNFPAVRYGRVPKRSRELGGNDETTTTTATSATTTNVRVSTPSTPNTPTTPQMCSVATPPEFNGIVSDPESGGSPDLSVYDIILCVSQAHRAHCTYTDELIRGLNTRPIPLTLSGGNDECEVSDISTTIKIIDISLCENF